MENLILESICRVKEISKKKVSIDNNINRIEETSAKITG